MTQALIGYTGFVGGNLVRQKTFDDCYNSSNISEIDNKNYEQVICAGVSAVKWLANREPVQDRENIQSLIARLKTFKSDKFILISTVDVYPNPIDVDENTEIKFAECQPYGMHRLELEEFITNEFDSLIIRLPGLFGTGLKKNIIYDFLNNNDIDKINPKGVFQFYSLDHLSKDIEIALKNNLKVLNISTEQTSVQEVAKTCMGHELSHAMDAPGITYNYKSAYAHLYGGNNGYLYSKEQVLSDLRGYVNREKGMVG